MVVLTVRILGQIVFMPFLIFYCVLPDLAVNLEQRLTTDDADRCSAS